jgi:hypothetical protein
MIDMHNSFTDARRLPTTHEHGLDVKRHEIQGHHPCIEFRDQTFGNMRKLSIAMHRKERLLLECLFLSKIQRIWKRES